MLPLDELGEHGHIDLITGLAGLLLSVLPFGDEVMDASSLRVARVLGRRLLDLCQEEAGLPPPPYPPGAPLLRGLPDLPRGLALCFARLRKSLGGQPLEHVSERLTAAVASLEASAWPDASESSPAWASLLIRHASGQPYAELSGGVNERLAPDPHSLNSDALLQRLELSLTAFRVTDDEQYHARAVATAQHLIHRKELTGSWIPDGFAPDRHNLSVIHGLGAVAHYFTCLYRPERARSILALE
jgi:hypothetical protein